MLLYLLTLPLFLSVFSRLNNYIDVLCENKDENMTKIIKKETGILTRKYRVVNVTKSGLLGLLTIPTADLLYKVIFYPENVNYYQVSLFAALYAGIDMAALIYNSKNHISTNIHHTVVQILYFYIYYYDFAMINLVRPIVTYACFSVFSYFLNGRLSIRNLNMKYENGINDLSLIIYINTSIFNWIAQIYLVFIDTLEMPFLYVKLLYTILVLIIVSDDIFLMKYLYHYRVNN